MSSRKRKKADDPLLNDCSACGANPGEGCKALDKNHRLISRATRLVHAVRIEEQRT